LFKDTALCLGSLFGDSFDEESSSSADEALCLGSLFDDSLDEDSSSDDGTCLALLFESDGEDSEDCEKDTLIQNRAAEITTKSDNDSV